LVTVGIFGGVRPGGVFLGVLLMVAGGCGLPDDHAFERMAEAIATTVAHDVGGHLAGMSPGHYGTAGVSYLTAELERRDVTVLGTHSENVAAAEVDRLQAWVDARFDFAQVAPEDRQAPVCLRFEVRWVHQGDYVTFSKINCPGTLAR
jgi:hypothetical protein